MNRTRDWRRQQRARIRRKRAHYDTVRWAHELGDGRQIDIATEHPACMCYQCQYLQDRRYHGASAQERRAILQANESYMAA